jgi:serine/threonine-protein kinase
MSPEQLAGTEVTVKSDLYSLGLLLYEIFTGKRAFEAASLMELMQMQERAAPASISSIVRDLDPAAERVILRCLAPDPRQRPSSARAVAAGLPGGDPLAAALAAGETPSPKLVAAAGETDGLPPKLAFAWLAAALVLIAAGTIVNPRISITSQLNLENSPDALTRDARRHLRNFGYTAKPADSAWGLEYPGGYKTYLTQHPKEAAARWRNPAAGQPPLVQFWYRESLQPLSAVHQLTATVDYGDPPFEQSGMLRLLTDPDGKLLAFEAVPPQVEQPAPPAPPFDWNKLFQAAGLEMDSFQTTEPTWTPLANWDTRAAWTGTDPATGAKLRIEAAAWRGRPISFRIVGPWTVPGRMAKSGNSSANAIPILVIICIALIDACVLGWHNFRAGKADRQGATRLALIFFATQTSYSLLAMHHTATMSEVIGFWTIIGTAMANAALNWVFYVALEPWVRRKWPHTIVSGNHREPVFPPLNALAGVRAEIAGVIMAVPDAIFTALLFFFILFLLRLVLRKDWIAGAAFVLIITFATSNATLTLGGLSDQRRGLRGFYICAAALRPAGRHRNLDRQPDLEFGLPARLLRLVRRHGRSPGRHGGAARGLRLPHLAGRPQTSQTGTVDSACSRSAIRSSACSRPMERRSRFCGVRVAGPSTLARCSMRLCPPPKLVARMNSLHCAATPSAESREPRTWMESMPPNIDICRAATLCPGCVARPG